MTADPYAWSPRHQQPPSSNGASATPKPLFSHEIPLGLRRRTRPQTVALALSVAVHLLLVGVLLLNRVGTSYGAAGTDVGAGQLQLSIGPDGRLTVPPRVVSALPVLSPQDRLAADRIVQAAMLCGPYAHPDIRNRTVSVAADFSRL